MAATGAALKFVAKTKKKSKRTKAALTGLAVLREDLRKLFDHNRALRQAAANREARQHGQIQLLEGEAHTLMAAHRDLLMSQGLAKVTAARPSEEDERLAAAFDRQLEALRKLEIGNPEDDYQLQAEALRKLVTALKSAFRGRVTCRDQWMNVDQMLTFRATKQHPSLLHKVGLKHAFLCLCTHDTQLPSLKHETHTWI